MLAVSLFRAGYQNFVGILRHGFGCPTHMLYTSAHGCISLCDHNAVFFCINIVFSVHLDIIFLRDTLSGAAQIAFHNEQRYPNSSIPMLHTEGGGYYPGKASFPRGGSGIKICCG